MNRILLIEDEQNVADVTKRGLEEAGYSVLHAMDGPTGIELLAQAEIDLVILDILLPKMSGLEVCRSIRTSHGGIPILMLTALASAENVVLGLDSGADDYLAKPFKLIELKARIRTLLRRTEISEPARGKSSGTYQFADIELDDDRKVVKRGGSEISLTSTEYRLLLTFMKNPRRVLSRTDLLDEVWGISYDIGTNVVDVYVNYLRKKLDRYGEEKVLQTVFGMGYVLKQA